METVVEKRSSFNPQYQTLHHDDSGRVTETVEFYHNKQVFIAPKWFKFEVVYYHIPEYSDQAVLPPTDEIKDKPEPARSRSSSSSSSDDDEKKEVPQQVLRNK